MSQTPMRRCGANKRGGGICQSTFVYENGRCKLHGGGAPTGVEAYAYKGRGYTRDMPTRLAERFQASMDDPDLISVRSEIALIDARLGELLGRLDSKASIEAIKRLGQVVAELRFVIDRPDLDDREEKLTSGVDVLEEVITAVHEDNASWREILETAQMRRRFADTERKREELLAGTLLSSQAMAFVSALQIAIHDIIPDTVVDVDGKTLKARLGKRIRQLLNKKGTASEEEIPLTEAEVLDP